MAGMTNYLRNKILDWFHRGESFTPPASVWITLVSTTPSAATAGTELTGTGYARQEIESTLTAWAGTHGPGTDDVSSGTSGITSNNEIIDFGTAGSVWGVTTHWELYDASSGGNRLMYGSIVDVSGVPVSRSINSGDPVSFPTSALTVPWI